MEKTLQGMDIKEVWTEYKRTRSEELRNKLVERYLPLVKYNADRIYAKLPDEVDIDDLNSAGVLGLIDAIKAFDLSRGVKFETYCAPRIRGAILDELRSMDWVPRLVRSRAHKLDAAAKTLQAEFGRTASDEELAQHLGFSQQEFIKLKRDATAVTLVSLSRKWFETDSQKDVCEIDVLEDKRGENPLELIQLQDFWDNLTKGLTRAEKLILVLYYHEQMTMKEIGATLDLSESRVSQMHSSIVKRLQAQLGHRKELAV